MSNPHTFSGVPTVIDQEDVYRTLSADDAEQAAPMEIESLCVNCEDNGITRLMLTRIPYYKAVILMSFACEHCGYRNNEIQSGEPVQEYGTEIVLRVQQQADLRRQVVKSEYAELEVPELELTVPARSQPGEVTTVEGVLERVMAGLSQEQDRRRELDPESAGKIDEFLAKVGELRELKQTWTLKLRDPTGNCFIQNPDPMHVDPRCITQHYARKLEERKLLGLADDNETEEEAGASGAEQEWRSFNDAKHEVLRFATDCPNCGAPSETLMKPTDIPYFDTVIIMALSCDRCGHKTNEVKAGGAIRDMGCKLSLSVEDKFDLARDVLKSDSCNLQIPELDMQVGYGALCGRFTTVEGLLIATKEQIAEQSRFFTGDSAEGDEKSKMDRFLEEFDKVLRLEKKITLVLDDPAGNSYIQSLSAPLDDPKLLKEHYVRNYEQNDELGINDMKVENYGELDGIAEEAEEMEEEGATKEQKEEEEKDGVEAKKPRSQ